MEEIVIDATTNSFLFNQNTVFFRFDFKTGFLSIAIFNNFEYLLDLKGDLFFLIGYVKIANDHLSFKNLHHYNFITTEC